MKKLQLYFDTSVFNFALADDVPAEREITLTLIEEVRQGRYNIFISDVVTEEVLAASKEKSKQLTDLINELKPVDLEVY